MMQSEEFTGKVVLVTGASQGIGLEICRQFSELGATVISVARNEEKLELARNSIKNNTNVYPYSCDLSVKAEIEKLFDFVEEKFQRIDVLVNNLGAFSEKKDWNEIDYDLWIKTFETNVLSAYFCMVRAAEIMVENKTKGVIINVGSSSALQVKKGRLNYTVSKSALHTMSRVTAMDLAKHQIRVNVVSPGPTATEIVQSRMGDPVQVLQESERLKKIPLGRYASTADIANAVVFMSSSKADFITGAILPVDGGYTIGETV
ncbi:MAG TPA: SDR family oxidoreductase [Anaerolineaceae bacterium]|nr:SDR family oxidoreductase [Anaerolineaceae bacterium]